MTLLRVVGAITLALAVAGVSATTAVAQDHARTTVTVGGATYTVEDGTAMFLAPGVTISGGIVCRNRRSDLIANIGNGAVPAQHPDSTRSTAAESPHAQLAGRGIPS